MKFTLFCLAVAMGMASSNHAAATILAYEGFNYSVGANLSGLNGGSGWNGGWIDVGGAGGATVGSAGLIANSNSPAGYDARSLGKCALMNPGNRAGRFLDCSPGGPFGQAGWLNSSGNIGKPGKTLYVSFLQQSSDAVKFYEFEFHRSDLGDAGRIAGIGNDFNATTVNLRAPNSVQTPMGMGNTNVSFYIVRIDYHGGNDDVTVYRNPTGQLESENEPVLTMLGAADMSFNGISLAAYLNSVSVRHDEIRFGQTWADVLGGPPAFVVQPTNQTAFVGQTITLTALADSAQPVFYQWYRGTNSLPGQTNSTFILSNVQTADAGHYSAVVSNSLGSAASFEMTLDVKVIGLDLLSQNLLVGPGSNLVINASVGGTPPLTLQWFKDGLAVPGATNATWAISNADFFDAGQYQLVASNLFGSVTSAPLNVLPNLGGLLAYEGFKYSPAMGDIGGANGGFGWSGAWVSLDGASSQILSNSLSANVNAPPGIDGRSLGGSLYQPNSSRKGRYLDCSGTGNFALHGFVDSNGNIGADGKTLYVSFLQRPSDVVQFYECEFHRNDLGDAGRMAGIGNDTTDHDVHLRVEVPAGGSSTFWDLGAGNTNVNFYVLRIDFKTGNDDVFLYRNPVSSTEPAVPTLTLSNVADMSFNGISFGAYLNNVSLSHDEIRLGMTWADAIGTSASQLELAQHTENISHIRVAGSSNYSFQLAGAPTVSGQWTNITTVVIPSSGISDVTETNGDPRRFYRLTGGTPNATWLPDGWLIADFEGTNYGTWTATGTAFGTAPAPGALPGQQVVSGFQDYGLANSFNGGDGAVGTLTSEPFVISEPYLNFLIGGGNLPGSESLNLIVSNVVVATATGANSETLTPMQWDLSAYVGQTAKLQIVDLATGTWGHILVDQIVASDIAFPSLSRQMVLTNNFLNLPVKNGSIMRRVTVTVGGKPVRDFKMQLADGTPDWWAFVDVSDFLGQNATITVDGLSPGSTGLKAVVQTNGIVGATNLYRETLRPQFHFSSKRGWLNDANGMIYYGGQYHFYYQHDPFNWGGNDQKYWGHAVSTDMVNWQEVKEALYPHSFGDWVWSGSAVVDSANTSGFKTGTNDVIVAAFYSTARGECIAYSNDRGLTFTDYVGNPVVVHNGRDPHLLWYAPSNYWVMAVYDETGTGGISIYSSPNLKQWTYRSKINGFFECPDLFSLPVDGNTNNMEWVLYDGSSGYMVGQFDGATFSPLTPKLPGNFGSGFYAAQTFTTMPPGDNRRVRIGWAILNMPGMPFNQTMFFPTTLTLQTLQSGVRLCSQPIAEMTNNFINSYSWTNLALNPGYNPVSGVRGETFDLKAEFTPQSAQSIQFVFGSATVTYSPATQEIRCNGLTQTLPIVNGTVQLEIIQDRQMLEIFGNSGQLYMPMAGTAYSPTNNTLSVQSIGNTTTFKSLVVNKMRSIWPGK